MAFSFDTATELFTSPNVILPAIGSFVCVWNPNYTPTDGVAHTIFDQRVSGDEANTTILITKFSDNNWYCGWYNHGEYRVVQAASGTFTQNVDHWIALTWDGTAQQTKFYINGSQVGSTSNTLVTFTPSTTLIIAMAQPGFDGGNHTLSEIGLYNAVLTQDDVTALYRGFSPLLVRRSALTNYWPLIGRTVVAEQDAIGGVSLAHSGTPVTVPQPRVIYPSRRRVFFQAPVSSRRFLLVRR